MTKFKNILLGTLICAIGVILTLNILEITDIDIFFDGWWTLFIIIPCLFGLIDDKDKTGNLIGLLIGVGLLLACQDYISFGLIMKLAIPVILIIVGLSFIFKDVIYSKIRSKAKAMSNKDAKECCATFASQNINFDNEEFQGCNLNAVFGGIKCDLRNAKITENQVITASAIFGGIDILVPNNVKVKVMSTSIFGGVDNHIVNKDSEITIFINSTCVFGGIEIK